jgi:hypothetical protein
MTSSNASIIIACDSIGARHHHHERSSSRQNMPSSSFDTDRSCSERTIARAVLGSPNRCSASARWPCDCRLPSGSQYFRACPSQ